MSKIDKKVISIVLVLILILGNVMPICSYAIEKNNSPTNNIEFESSELKQQLVWNCDANGDGEISEEEILSLTNLSVREISSLNGLEYATNLANLHLENCSLLTEIPALPNMQNISISGDKVTTLLDLSKITNSNNRWISLSIQGTNIESIEGLENAVALRSLYLYNNSKLTNIGESQYITSVNIENCDLIKQTDISLFPNIENLNISANDIVNIQNINGLQRLSSISLNNNTSIQNIGSSSYVRNLHISGNETTQIPDISGLTELSSFSISNTNIVSINNISGIRSISLYNNAKLEKVSGANELQEVHISGLNVKVPDFSECTTLSRIGLSNIENVDLTELNNAPQITNLSLGWGIQQQISGLNYIKYISISSGDTLPQISNMLQLTNLSINYTQATDLSGITGLEKLESLSLYGNSKLTDISAIQGLTKLKRLDLGASTTLTDISVIGKLEKLEYLSISSGNAIKDLTILEGLTNLSNLNLSGTSLETISLPNATKLQHLSLYNNDKLTTISNMPNIAQLSIQGENITTLPKIENLNNLKSIDIYNTKITEISNIENVESLSIQNTTNIQKISNMAALKSLSISNTNIQNLNLLENLDKLEDLRLSNNQNLSDISKIANFLNLELLYVSNSPITNINAISALPKLKSLELTDTQVREIPESSTLENIRLLDNEYLEDFGEFSNLTNISIYNSNIEQIAEISRMTKLEYLSIVNTELTSLPDLSALINLKRIYISGNENLVDISNLQTLPNLLNLDLSYNNSILDFSCLKQLRNIKTLSISENTFNDITTLKNMSKLQNLYLVNTSITTLEGLGELENLTDLSIINNSHPISKIENLPNIHCLQINNCNVLEINNLPELYKISISDQSNLPKFNNLEKVKNLEMWGVETQNLDELKSLVNLKEVLIYDNESLTDISVLKQLEHLIDLQIAGVSNEVLRDFYEIEEECIGVVGSTINPRMLFKYKPYNNMRTQIEIEDENIATIANETWYNQAIYLKQVGTSKATITISGNNGEIETFEIPITVTDVNNDELETTDLINADVVGKQAILTATGELWKTDKETMRKQAKNIKKYISNEIYYYRQCNFEFILKNNQQLEVNMEDKKTTINNVKDINELGYVDTNNDYYLIKPDGTFMKTLSNVKELNGIFIVKDDDITYNVYGTKISESELKETALGRSVNENWYTGYAGFEDGTLYKSTINLNADSDYGDLALQFSEQYYYEKITENYKCFIGKQDYYLGQDDKIYMYWDNNPYNDIDITSKYYDLYDNQVKLDSEQNLYIDDTKIMTSVLSVKRNGYYNLTILRTDGSVYNFSVDGSSGITKLGTLGQRTIGDADGDDEITSFDAYRALECSIEQGELAEAQKRFIDIDNDGFITAFDAYKILEYSIGIIDENFWK